MYRPAGALGGRPPARSPGAARALPAGAHAPSGGARALPLERRQRMRRLPGGEGSRHGPMPLTPTAATRSPSGAAGSSSAQRAVTSRHHTSSASCSTQPGGGSGAGAGVQAPARRVRSAAGRRGRLGTVASNRAVQPCTVTV